MNKVHTTIRKDYDSYLDTIQEKLKIGKTVVSITKIGRNTYCLSFRRGGKKNWIKDTLIVTMSEVIAIKSLINALFPNE